MELPLQLLSAADVTQYLEERFGARCVLHWRSPSTGALTVIRCLGTLVDALVQQGLVHEVWAVGGNGDLTAVEGVIPESLRQLIAQQCDMLSPVAQRVLEAASVAGMASAVAAIVAAVETTDEAIETECTCLAQRGQRCRRTE